MCNNSKVAVIFTCFNRKEKTIRCIKSILEQTNMPPFDLYVCDDGSTDGTSAAIRQLIPEAFIVQGNGNLFWSKGMHAAMIIAVEARYDYYLMVNDDVDFFPTMWKCMFAPYDEGKTKVAVVGSTKSRCSGTATYGGRKLIYDKSKYYESPVISPNSNEYMECDVANWNCFLMDKYIQLEVGLIDPRFAHGLGDYDYSLRIRETKHKILIAKEYIGYCENNTKKHTYMDSSLPRIERLRLISKANGFPVKAWILYVGKHYKKAKFRNMFSPLIKDYLKILVGKDI